MNNKLQKALANLTQQEHQLLKEFHERRQTMEHHLLDMKIGRYTCPSCGFPSFLKKQRYEVCLVCSWEDEPQNENQILHPSGPNDGESLFNFRLQTAKTLNNLKQQDREIKPLNPTKALQLLQELEKKADYLTYDRIREKFIKLQSHYQSLLINA